MDTPPSTVRDPPAVNELDPTVEKILSPPYTMTLATVENAGVVSRISIGVT